MQRLIRQLQRSDILLLALLLQCLLVGGVAAVEYSSGLHPKAKRLRSMSASMELFTLLKSENHPNLVQTSDNAHIIPPTTPQPAHIPAQVPSLIRRQRQASLKVSQRRSKRALRSKRASHKLHEVPSGPNPISNEIPTKFVDAQNVPNSMP